MSTRLRVHSRGSLTESGPMIPSWYLTHCRFVVKECQDPRLSGSSVTVVPVQSHSPDKVQCLTVEEQHRVVPIDRETPGKYSRD